ncbi:hypothetical protein PY257_07935 [Ramlibacter sp. H39-3-26]|uniref:hypothetical protein n=1 Tax=Curvibacter soli TaxID=3031331 RepID=UPI0023DCA0AB|nr:hypothetical protein [Ramlibacter sp. H39-3-26]MDF1485110.1 hypothetical protein [Ramlibacter sp. H39-3-26]
MHRHLSIAAIAAPLLCGTGGMARAQATAPATGYTVQAQDPCRAEYSKFEQAIGFARQTQGTEAAAALKEKLLPAKTADEILFKDGYCGLVKYLRQKKLLGPADAAAPTPR